MCMRVAVAGEVLAAGAEVVAGAVAVAAEILVVEGMAILAAADAVRCPVITGAVNTTAEAKEIMANTVTTIKIMIITITPRIITT